ncbi:MAG: tetratricopeptide repeat protein [bacterium]
MPDTPKGNWQTRLGVWLPTLAIVAAAFWAFIAYQRQQEINLISPEKFQDWYSLCVSFRNAGRTDKAVRACEQAARIDPNADIAWANLGLLYTDQKRYPKAIDAFQRALRIGGDRANMLNNLGIAYKLSGNLEQAIVTYQRVIAISPDFVKAHFNLGNAYREKQEWDKAAEEYRIVTEKAPTDGDALYNLARCDARTKYYAEAISALARAIQINPGYVTLAAKSNDFAGMRDNPDFQSLLRADPAQLENKEPPGVSPEKDAGSTEASAKSGESNVPPASGSGGKGDTGGHS